MLTAPDLEFHRRECALLTAELVAARDAGGLPEAPAPEARRGLDELLLRLRGFSKAG